MTSGKLAMIVCPILEDELIHNLINDKEEKNLFLLQNDNTSGVIEELDKNGLKYTVLNEDDYLNGSVNVPDDGYNVIIWMMSLGLHQEPEDLKKKVREEMLRIDGKTNGIMLYYGLCGQALKDIDVWSNENIKTPVTIFKDSSGRICDDCICVPLGGTDNYLKLLKKYPGVMYLTPAMACNQDEFISKMEIFRGFGDVKDFDALKMLLDMAGYTRALKLQTGLGDQEHFQAACEEYTRKLGLKLDYLEDGWLSNEVADRTYSEAKKFLSQ